MSDPNPSEQKSIPSTPPLSLTLQPTPDVTPTSTEHLIKPSIRSQSTGRESTITFKGPQKEQGASAQLPQEKQKVGESHLLDIKIGEIEFLKAENNKLKHKLNTSAIDITDRDQSVLTLQKELEKFKQRVEDTTNKIQRAQQRTQAAEQAQQAAEARAQEEIQEVRRRTQEQLEETRTRCQTDLEECIIRAQRERDEAEHIRIDAQTEFNAATLLRQQADQDRLAADQDHQTALATQAAADIQTAQAQAERLIIHQTIQDQVHQDTLILQVQLAEAESGEEISMTSHKTFSGKELDDPVKHVKRFKLDVASKKLPVPAVERLAATMGYFAQTLVDAANEWFDQQDLTTIADMDALYTAFQNRFAFSEPDQWRENQIFKQTKQLKMEPVQDFIRRIEAEGVRIHSSDIDIKDTILQGLLPHILHSVMQHDLAGGLADIRKWAKMAERYGPVTPQTSDLSEIKSTLNDLATRLERTQLRALTPERKTVQFEKPTAQFSRSVSPDTAQQTRRSRYDVYTGELLNEGQPKFDPQTGQRIVEHRATSRPVYEDRSTSYTRIDRSPSASYQRESNQNSSRGYNNIQRSFNNDQGRSNRGGPPRRGMQPYRGVPRNNQGSYIQDQTFRRSTSSINSSGCSNCNNSDRCRQGQCWASDKTCYNCNRIGHLANKCRARNNQ